MMLSTRKAAAPASRRSRSSVVSVRAYVTDAPPNVLEARAWIAAWKARSAAPAAPAAPAKADVPANVAEARQWIAAWKARQTPAAAAAAPVAAAPAAAPAAHKPAAKAAPAAAPAAPAAPKPVVSADGTITFSSQMLDSIKADELLKKLKKN
ncbi:hypothetical protein HXX76_009562 [Chlamydomonas incerta]|uniref:Uncharacterized protein n=1 Tax=Chlamydomonas incerta TaxID=51695 RepID=A0A835VZE9_CHLIN|nr:hypothetical protein HXX76_009562 [Chlamydomonas incerta]|eukprot:KAG2431548.1 hypothetical protein HXX76_009562 [Chlamydomonas incerta]